MEIKIRFQIWLLISIIKLVNCRAIIKQTDHRIKRSTFNDSSTVSINQTNHLNNFTDFQNLNSNNVDKVHFTTPRISTDRWIPLPGKNVNSSFVISDVNSSEQSDQRASDEQVINNDQQNKDQNTIEGDKFMKLDNNHKKKPNSSGEQLRLIEKRIDEGIDNGLIKVEKFDPIQTSASDHMMVKNYNGYLSNESVAKKEPQVQYDEFEALNSLNELEKRLRDQLELLENHKKIFNQQQQITYPTNSPTIQYENAPNTFRSLGSDNSTQTYISSLTNGKKSNDYLSDYNSQLGRSNQQIMQDVYAKINFSTKSPQVNNFLNYQTNDYLNKLNHQSIVRPVKPAEVQYLDKEELLNSEIPNAILSTGEQSFGQKSNASLSDNFLTYQPPIPTFVTSQPSDEYTHVHNHLQSTGLSSNQDQLNSQQFRNFQNNQLQPYLYKPLMKSTLATATPMSYTPTTTSSTNPMNLFNSLNPISFQPKPTEYPAILSEFNKSPNYLSTTRSTISPFNLQTPTSYIPSSVQNKTLRMPNESFRSIYNVPGISGLSSKIIESSSHLSQLNLNPQYVQNNKKSVAYLDQPSSIKEYDLRPENNPNQIQYLNNENDKNYLVLSEQNAPTSSVTYRNQYNSPTISSAGIIHSSNSMNGNSNSNELNAKLTDSEPIHVINSKTQPITSNGDYVKVYDEKTNEMYYIKSNDFNHLKTTHPKLDLIDIRRPNKDYYESPSSEATRELLKAVEAVKTAVIKVKPFKHYATRAVSDLASKLKDHIKSFASTAGTYSSFPYTDLSEFNYEMKRDPIYMQHFDEYTGKVLSGSVEKDSMFNQLKGVGYAKPDFLGDSDHLNIIEPISLNSDRDTVKQNVTLGLFPNSSIVGYNDINRQMTIKPKNSNNQTANFIDSKQKIDYFNRLIDEQKRSNQQKQKQSTTQPHQFTNLVTSPPSLQSTQHPPVANFSSSGNIGKPGQTTRYVTRIAIKPNRPPVVEHFKYVQSVNLKPISLAEQPIRTVNYRQVLNHNEHQTFNNHMPPNHAGQRPMINEQQPQLNYFPAMNEPTNLNYPMGLPRNYHQIDIPNHHSMNNHMNHPINHHLNSPPPPPPPPEYHQPMHHFNHPHHHQPSHHHQPLNYHGSNMNEPSMIVQESKQFATYSTQSSENLTDYPALPKTDLLRLTALNRNNATGTVTGKNDTFESGQRRGVSRQTLDGFPRTIKTNKPIRSSNQNGTGLMNKIRLPEQNFQYDPKFSLILNPKTSKTINKNRQKNSGGNSKIGVMRDETDYFSSLDDSYSNLNNILNQNLLEQLLLNNQNDAASITSNRSLLSFEPTSFTPFEAPPSVTPYTPFTSFAPSTPDSNWLFQTVTDQMIDLPSNALSSNPLVTSNAHLSNSHPSMKYNPQLITIASLPLLHQNIPDHLSNGLPFDYSNIKSPNNLFVTSSENNAKLNQVYQMSTSNDKQGQESKSRQMKNQSNNANVKLDQKSLTNQQQSAASFEFLTPIRNRLQKLYRNLIDGQQKRSRVTINVVNNRQGSATKSGDYEPAYRVMEFNEQNLREILNGDEDADLLASLLEDEQMMQKRNDQNAFNKRTLDIDSQPESNDTKNNESEQIKKYQIEKLIRNLSVDNLLKLSEFAFNSIDLKNHTESSIDSLMNATNNSIDHSFNQSIDDRIDLSNDRQLTEHNSVIKSNYRQASIDQRRRMPNANENSLDNNHDEQGEVSANGIRSIIANNLNENESKKQLITLLYKLFKLKDQIPEEKTMREKTQIEVYEREHLFDSSTESSVSNQTVSSSTKSPIRSWNESRKVNYYRPSATWFVPTIVYDQFENRSNKSAINAHHTSNRFGMRKIRNSISNQPKSDQLNEKSLKNFKSTNHRSNSIENRMNEPVASNKRLTIVTNSKLPDQTTPIATVLSNINQTKPGLLKTKEKGFKIITEFELIHKDLTANDSNKAINQTIHQGQPSFRVHLVERGVDNGDEVNLMKFVVNGTKYQNRFRNSDLVNSATGDSRVLTQQSLNNEEYLEDIRKQIRKELPDIDRDELDRLAEQFQNQNPINITEFVDNEDESKQQVSESMNNRIISQSEKNPTDENRLRKTIRRMRPTNKEFRLESENNLKNQRIRPVESKFLGDDFMLRRSNNSKILVSNLNDKECNKTTIENDELNTRMLNQINDLLEQQFKSLKDELKANRSSDIQSNEKNFKFTTIDTKMLIDQSHETDSESKQIKSKASYIPEHVYNIEKDGNGVKRVMQKPFINNLLAQKKFMNAFKSSSNDQLKSNAGKTAKSIVNDQTVSSNRQILRQIFKAKRRPEEKMINLEDAEGRLNIGDYDSLY